MWPKERFSFANEEDALQVERAEEFLELLKYRFADRPAVVDEIVSAVSAFIASELDTVEVMERVASRFQHEPQLLARFNTFLPPGYRIQPVPTGHIPYVVCDDSTTAHELAHSFLERLMVQLRSAPHVVVALLKAIDRLPSSLTQVQSMGQLLVSHASEGDKEQEVAGMTAEQAEEVRAAAKDIEALLKSCTPPADELLVELMNYLPLGLQSELCDVLNGYTHYVVCDDPLPALALPPAQSAGVAEPASRSVMADY